MFVYIFSGCEQQREYLQQQQHQLGGGGHEAVAMASRGGCVIQTNASAASSNCGSANCGSLNRRHHPIGSDQVARNSSTLTRRSAAAGASTASSSHIHHHVTASGTLNRCPISAEASLLRRSSSTSNRYFFDQLCRLNLSLGTKNVFQFHLQIHTISIIWEHLTTLMTLV